MFNEDNLVHISVILYSKDSEQFFCNKVSPRGDKFHQQCCPIRSSQEKIISEND